MVKVVVINFSRGAFAASHGNTIYVCLPLIFLFFFFDIFLWREKPTIKPAEHGDQKVEIYNKMPIRKMIGNMTGNVISNLISDVIGNV